uniref:Uncharacterized protein n=1 Tax=Anopheles arabiensis TaxID=7173 RepID=A0A182IFU9_ANOAR
CGDVSHTFIVGAENVRTKNQYRTASVRKNHFHLAGGAVLVHSV